MEYIFFFILRVIVNSILFSNYFVGGTSVFITDPEYAKQVLVTNSMNYGRNDALLSFLPALGTGLITTGGKEHAIMRKNLNPAFTLGSVKEFISTFNMKASQLVKVRALSPQSIVSFLSFIRSGIFGYTIKDLMY